MKVGAGSNVRCDASTRAALESVRDKLRVSLVEDDMVVWMWREIWADLVPTNYLRTLLWHFFAPLVATRSPFRLFISARRQMSLIQVSMTWYRMNGRSK